MFSYLKSGKKHTSDIPYIAFNLYSNIGVPTWVDIVDSCIEPNRGVVEVDFTLS